jgi:membrane protein
MSDAERRIEGYRALAERIAGRLAGNPGVLRVQTIMDTYDRAGGGLVASGLAYTSLLALLPGLLLGFSIVGLLVRDPASQERIVNLIGQALPPLEDIARIALQQVSAGAVPTSILAIVTLLWGASRFYANLDTSFSRIFNEAPRRNPIVQTIRGVLLTVILILVPIALLIASSLVNWMSQFAPNGVNLSTLVSALLQLASPIGSLLAFIAAVALCYRMVPSERVPWRALLLPASGVGLVLAVFTQIYAFIAPRLMGIAALYGTVFAILGLLAWLSIAFNVLLVGAAWAEARTRTGPVLKAAVRELRAGEDEAESPGGTKPRG